MLFLESPAGVGFSYSNTSADMRVGERQGSGEGSEHPAEGVARAAEVSCCFH